MPSAAPVEKVGLAVGVLSEAIKRPSAASGPVLGPEKPAMGKETAGCRSARRIDVIVVYKVDRVTRSLADFAKLVETWPFSGGFSGSHDDFGDCFFWPLCSWSAGCIEFSVVAARRIEKAVPPQGGFLDLDGERLHVLDKGVGPPVVMIHGLSGQMGNFTHSLVDRLCKDFRVVAFDRPGSGYSTRSAKSPAGVRAQAETLAKAIRALKLDRPVVVGHSFGGAVALTLALDHPDCVGALALISPATHPVPAPPTVFRVLAIRSPLLRRLFAWTLATPGGLLARTWAAKKVFAPEAPPVDFATRGGGLLALRPGNIYATSLDMMTVLAHSDDAEN